MVVVALIVIAAIIVLVVVWSRSNVAQLGVNEYKSIVYNEARMNFADGKKPSGSDPGYAEATYKGQVITSFTAQGSKGNNTTVISGVLTLANDNKVAYQAQFDTTSLNKWRYQIKDWYSEAPRPDDWSGASINSNTDIFYIAAYNEKDKSYKAPLVNQFLFTDRTYVPTWESALIAIVPWVLFAILFIFFLRVMMKAQSGGMNPFRMGGNKAKRAESKLTFKDVAGIKDEKDELIELVDYLKQPQKYASAGARVPKGVLLEGPPGTGKTLLAKAVAGEAGVPFYAVSGSEFEEVFVGLGASRIRSMFQEAKKNAPCIVFIDEIDAIGRKRDKGFGNATGEQTLNQLLVELDGFSTNTGIIVIAASNMAHVLDTALLRPGRFDRKITVTLPVQKEREAILKLHAANKNISSSVDFYRLAQITPGFSGAQLENVLNEAAILAVRNNKKMIDNEILEEAIDRVVGGPAKKSRTYSVIDKKIVSYHEAGHALLGIKLKYGNKVQKITIIPRGAAGGYTVMAPEEENVFQSKKQLLGQITCFLGGRASEEIIFGKDQITTGAHDDFKKATYLARKMIVKFGMSPLGMIELEDEQTVSQSFNKAYSDEVAHQIDQEIKNIFDRSYVIALKTIKENRELLDLLALALRYKEIISAEDIEYIDKYMKLPPSVVQAQKQAEEHAKKKAAGDIIEIKPHSTPQSSTISKTNKKVSPTKVAVQPKPKTKPKKETPAKKDQATKKTK